MLCWGRVVSVPEKDQRSEKIGWMEEREVEMQGAGRGELAMYEWVVE